MDFPWPTSKTSLEPPRLRASDVANALWACGKLQLKAMECCLCWLFHQFFILHSYYVSSSVYVDVVDCFILFNDHINITGMCHLPSRWQHFRMPCDEGRWRLYRCGDPSGIEVRRGGWCSLAGRPDDPIRFRDGDRWSWASWFHHISSLSWDISGLQEVPLRGPASPHPLDAGTGKPRSLRLLTWRGAMDHPGSVGKFDHVYIISVHWCVKSGRSNLPNKPLKPMSEVHPDLLGWQSSGFWDKDSPHLGPKAHWIAEAKTAWAFARCSMGAPRRDEEDYCSVSSVFLFSHFPPFFSTPSCCPKASAGSDFGIPKGPCRQPYGSNVTGAWPAPGRGAHTLIWPWVDPDIVSFATEIWYWSSPKLQT